MNDGCTTTVEAHLVLPTDVFGAHGADFTTAGLLLYPPASPRQDDSRWEHTLGAVGSLIDIAADVGNLKSSVGRVQIRRAQMINGSGRLQFRITKSLKLPVGKIY